MPARTRQPDDKRARILDAAEAIFAKRGFAGASMRDVARTARVPQSLIHHHFATKKRLWQAVAARLAEGYLARQTPALRPATRDAAALKQALAIDFEFWRERPDMLRLQTWAILEGGDLFGAKRDAMYAPFVPLVRALQKAGHVRADVEPLHLVAIAAAAVTFWMQYREQIAKTLGRNPKSAAPDQAFLADLQKILFDGVTAQARGKR